MYREKLKMKKAAYGNRTPAGAAVLVFLIMVLAGLSPSPLFSEENNEVYTYSEDENNDDDQVYTYSEDTDAGEDTSPAGKEGAGEGQDQGLSPSVAEEENKEEEKKKAGLEISGSLLTDNGAYHYLPGGNSDRDGELAYAGIQKFSLRAVNRDREKAKIEADLSLTLLSGQNADYYAAELAQYGLPADIPLFGSSPLLFSINKLYVSLFFNSFDFTLGRNLIHFGTGVFFSPLDTYSAVDFSSLDYSKTGSDIIQARLFFGPLSGIEAVTTMTTEVRDMDAAAKVFWHLLGFDWSVVGMRRGSADEWVFGASFVGDIEIGVHGEAAVHFADESGGPLPEYQYLEGMAGIDYSFFRRDLVLLLEYYFNTGPVNTEGKNLAELSQEDRTYFDRHYLFFSAEVTPTELMRISASALWNIEETKAVITGQFLYSLFQNTDLTLYSRYFAGQINGLDSLQPFDLQYGVKLEVNY